MSQKMHIPEDAYSLKTASRLDTIELKKVNKVIKLKKNISIRKYQLFL